MTKLADLRLPIGLFRFTLVPLEPLFVPAVNKSNMLRGGFGHVFRRLCCIPQCKEAKSCPLAASCPYKIIFEPSPTPGAERLSKNHDIPRPFVFRAPQTQQTRFYKDERFQFDLILIGRALDFLPYFVLSFRELASEGLGLNRARCVLEEVRELKLGCNGTRDPLGAETGARLRARTANLPVSDTQDRFDRRWLGAHASCVHSDNPDTFDTGDPPRTTDPQSEIHDHHVTLGASTVVYSDKEHLFHATSSTDAAQWIETRLRSFSALTGSAPEFPGLIAVKPASDRGRDIQHPTPDTRHPTPETQHPSPNTQHLVLDTRHPAPTADPQRITISFLTPTFLRANGAIIRVPEFHHVFKRLRDRINALSTFYGDGPLDVDFRNLGERAEQIRTISAQTDWLDRFRRSSKTKQRHELSGFVGQATYEGELHDFLPWLASGELVHVGKHAAWGNGWIEIARLQAEKNSKSRMRSS